MANDIGAFRKSLRRFITAGAKLSVFDGLAAFADAEVETAIGHDVHHGVGLRKIQRVVQRQYRDGNAEPDARSHLRHRGKKGRRVWQIAAVTAEVVFGHPRLVEAEFFHLDNLLVHASVEMRQ